MLRTDRFLIAARDGELATVTKLAKGSLLRKPVGVDSMDGQGNTALAIAAHCGRKQIVEYLLAMGANVNSTNALGATPLLLAVQNGHAEVVNTLLKEGAAVNVFDQIGRTPLMEVRTAHIEELLVANGAIDIFDAVKAGNVPFVSEFLAKLASRNAAHLSLPFLQHRTNKDGDTLLPLAIACGQHGFAKSLIGVHADVNHRNRLGDTALMMAVSNRDSDAVKLLLSAGAKVNVANVKGQTPLRLARDVDDKVLCELLAEKCVHIWGAGETKDQESNACLHVSVCSDCGTAKREYVHDYSIVSHKSERGRDWQSSDTDYVCKKCGKTDHKHTWEYTDW